MKPWLLKKSGLNPEDIIPIEVENKKSDEKIESRKKPSQEESIQLIKDEKDYRAELTRGAQEKTEEEKKRKNTQRVKANENSKQSFDELIHR
jgi:hypothetical protein